MQPHDPGVEVGQHGDAADHGLRRDAGEEAQRQQEEVPAFLAQVPQVHQHQDSDGGQGEGQQPVAELDEPVDAHLRRGGSEPSVQRGQVGQPRPDPVSRTAPPVTTRSVWPIRDSHSQAADAGIDGTGSRGRQAAGNLGRREAGLTVISIPLEPTDGCCAGQERVQISRTRTALIDRRREERLAQPFAERT